MKYSHHFFFFSFRTFSYLANMLSRRFYSTTARKLITPLTSVKHPSLQRGPYKKLDTKDLEYFSQILSPQQIVTETEPYNIDFFNLYRGSSKLCIFPTTVQQVSSILKYCNDQRLAVVPQGGNTGVSGGAIPVFDEIIINTSKMNKIRSFDPVSGIVIADAGVILEELDQAIEPHGFTVPLDLGAKGSCQLGGNVSTNAGGLRLMRFGNLHGNVLGLEVVLPDGTIMDGLSSLRKDNTGYDLKQLFIGAEGTLGMVTGVCLLTPKRAKSINVAMLAMDSFDQVQSAFVAAKRDLCEILSAFEFWDHDSVELVQNTILQDQIFPMKGKISPFYALIETQGSREDHDMEKLDQYLGQLMEKGVIQNGVLAQDTTQIKSLWQWREKIPEAITVSGTAMTYDVSMNIRLFPQMMQDVKTHFESKGLLGSRYTNILGFGHVGDGNLHIMANMHGFDQKEQEEFDDYIFNWTIKHKGSLSAEHGVGIHKVDYMIKSKNPIQLQLMHKIKSTLDKKGIMNPYKVLP
ncbi:uncharacterized protein BX664DRAFT_332036 [Halteromyces radiatus]|uniref:uncharacterized protein n=1 Tax=Halteromyces radiatus TaxID=101107 RepID=UPI00221E7314|nr:uncharacterized protein BX664DRAFT_332036 [Halteromyces radiatus]KAI8089043.1 hypothetical protein BX664DRAFT_332036 [Halteromyces radiatus]